MTLQNVFRRSDCFDLIADCCCIVAGCTSGQAAYVGIPYWPLIAQCPWADFLPSLCFTSLSEM